MGRQTNMYRMSPHRRLLSEPDSPASSCSHLRRPPKATRWHCLDRLYKTKAACVLNPALPFCQNPSTYLHSYDNCIYFFFSFFSFFFFSFKEIINTMRQHSVGFLMVSRSAEHLRYFWSYHMKYWLSQAGFPSGRFKILKFLKHSYAP